MSNPKEQDDKKYYQVVKTIGDGSCLFNALILDLAEEDVLASLRKRKQIDSDLQYFIHGAALALGLPKAKENFEAVSEALIVAKKQDSLGLQRTMNPVLRKWLMHEISDQRTHMGKQYFDNTERNLLAELSNYMNNPKTKEIDLLTLPFIKTKCDEIIKDNLPDEVPQAVKAWWETEGYADYVLKMGTTGLWGGAMEIAVLGEKMDINISLVNNMKIDVDHNKSTYKIYEAQDPNAPTLYFRNDTSKAETAKHWESVKIVSEEELHQDVLAPESAVINQKFNAYYDALLENAKGKVLSGDDVKKFENAFEAIHQAGKAYQDDQSDPSKLDTYREKKAEVLNAIESEIQHIKKSP